MHSKSSNHIRKTGFVGFVLWEFRRFFNIVPLAMLLIGGWSAKAFAEDGSAPGAVSGFATDPLAMDRLLGMTVTLVIIVGVIVAGGFLLRHFRGPAPGPAGGMRVRGHLALGPKERIVLVEAGDTQLLVGLTPGRLQTLHVLDKPVAIEAARPATTGNFAGRLRAVMARSRG